MGGKSGPYKSLEELKEEMCQAIRSGRIDRNVADHLVEVLKVGKPRARKLRDWAEQTRLFEKIAAGRSESS